MNDSDSRYSILEKNDKKSGSDIIHQIIKKLCCLQNESNSLSSNLFHLGGNSRRHHGISGSILGKRTRNQME